SPFWSGQPENADMFGAVARDPSYLYQYLMSFPYRLVSLFTNDQTIMVLTLRALNIGLFAGGVALYRRLGLKTGLSAAAVNVCVLIFILIPITPLLAAQINYDNLLLPASAVALLLAVNFEASLTKRKQLDVKLLLQLLIVCLLTCLVKYAFLPMFLAIIGFIIVVVWRYYRSLSKAGTALVAGWQRLSLHPRIVLLAVFVLSAGLFIQRYGENIAVYHTPVPDCSKVLTVEQCKEYGPWIRDYYLKQANTGSSHSPLIFTADWLYGMWLRTFFAVDGPTTYYQTRGPLLIPGVGAIVFAVAGLAAVIAGGRRVLKKYNTAVIWLLAATTLSYVGALWLDEYQAFLRTGQAVAINGRYLLPVLIPVFVITAAAADELLRNKRLKVVLASVAVICLLWGGGALTYILRSNDAWYWPNPAVRTANHAVQRVLGPVTPGYRHATQFMH
ncbi:MAG TPA: hypothetical protein VII55_01535, partial [Candidatus Saccharimonadales bacterium]